MIEIASLKRADINWESINALYSGVGELPDLKRTTLEDGSAAIDAITDYIKANNCVQVNGSLVFPSGGVRKESARSVLGVTFTKPKGTFCGPFIYLDTDVYVPQGMAYYTLGTILAAEL